MKRIVQYKNGNTLSYATYGRENGFPILVQHGLIASIEDEELFDCLLERGARLISIARPGYGGSSPYVMKSIGEYGEIVSSVVEGLGLAHFDVFGISSGAPYSYAIGWRFPKQVRNIYILSGTPALYDARVLSHWPYPINQNASIGALQKLAYDLFFRNLSQADMARNDIKDSMMNNGFGIAQDLKIRCMEWGFELKDVKPKAVLRHSKTDDSVPFITADIAAGLLPDCEFDVRETDAHFSKEILEDFVRTKIR